jgi:integrase
LVWCQPNAYPIDTHVDWEEWKEILGQAGIKDVRLHDARQTAGTLLGELHVDIHVIQRILGHAQVTTTRIYTDPTDPLTREATDRIGELLWPAEAPSDKCIDGQDAIAKRRIAEALREHAAPGQRS